MEDSEAARLERLESSGVASWERWRAGSEEVARRGWCEGCEVSRWEMWENGEVVGLEVPAFIQVWVTQGES